MKFTYRVTLTDKDKKETIVYIFNFVELVTMMHKINPEYYDIKVEEQDNVIDFETFLETEEHLLTQEFWLKIKNQIDNNPFGSN